MSSILPSQEEFLQMKNEAKALLHSGFLPSSIQNIQEIIAILLLGQELKISLWQAITGIRFAEGKLTLNPQLILALIERSGQLEEIKIEGNEKQCLVLMKRKGRSPHQERVLLEEIKQRRDVHILDWEQEPTVILKWQAISECASVVFADILMGMAGSLEKNFGFQGPKEKIVSTIPSLKDSASGQAKWIQLLSFPQKKESSKREQLQQKFVRKLPDEERYHQRLAREFELTEKFRFWKIFEWAVEILQLSKGIPHLTRGSAGSSLICYLLGISNIDPIAEQIPLSRFMNSYRSDAPDIDIDFPHLLRERVLERLYIKFGNKVARISNHLHYKERGAIREALRQMGYHQHLPRKLLLSQIVSGQEDQVLELASQLLGQRSGYALHCGGVIFFEDGIPGELQIGPHQIKLSKKEAEQKGLLKIDLLCNRGFTQLIEIDSRPLESYPKEDQKTAEIFCQGNVLGLTYGESPTFQHCCLAIQPKNSHELAMVFALIRPAAARQGKKREFMKQWQASRTSSKIIFEDDAIIWIQSLLQCSEDEAEKYRRAFAKENRRLISEFTEKLGSHPKKKEIIEALQQLRTYSFCKAHALSYSKLVWALAYHKARNPKKFWQATLKHCHSMYRKWVHYQEAKKAGLDITPPQKSLFKSSPDWEYETNAYWYSPGFVSRTYREGNSVIRFRGLIACYRNYQKKEAELTFITIGFADGSYLDLNISGVHPAEDFDYVEGEGILVKEFGSSYCKVKKFQLQLHFI